MNRWTSSATIRRRVERASRFVERSQPLPVLSVVLSELIA
jgi:hypothetical protein